MVPEDSTLERDHPVRPHPPAVEANRDPRMPGGPASRGVARSDRARKVRATFYLPTDLVDDIRDAVVHLSGPPLRLTLASLAERAFARELERLRLSQNAGTPFPRRSGPLRGGRPIAS